MGETGQGGGGRRGDGWEEPRMKREKRDGKAL